MSDRKSDHQFSCTSFTSYTGEENKNENSGKRTSCTDKNIGEEMIATPQEWYSDIQLNRYNSGKIKLSDRTLDIKRLDDKFSLDEKLNKFQQYEKLKNRPFILKIENFLSEEECQAFIKSAKNPTQSPSGSDGKVSDFRTSIHHDRPDWNSCPTLKKVFERAKELFECLPGMKISGGWPIKYEPGGKIDIHHDAVKYGWKNATGIIYLSTVPEGKGGETRFPSLYDHPNLGHGDYDQEKDKEMTPRERVQHTLTTGKGAIVHPVAGHLVWFRNIINDVDDNTRDGCIDWCTRHEGLPPDLDVVKWFSQFRSVLHKKVKPISTFAYLEKSVAEKLSELLFKKK
jgi:hypothetical protein